MIAALYVETNGVYYGLPDVDPWDEARDARLYNGPHPVVAHPPCQRWGRYWGGGRKRQSQARARRRRWVFRRRHRRRAQVWGRLRAPRGFPCVVRTRTIGSTQNGWVVRSRRLAGLDVLRRARSLWAPRAQGDMALCRAVRVAITALGRVEGRSVRGWLSLIRGARKGSRCWRRTSQAAIQGRALGHTNRVPRLIVGNGKNVRES